MSTPYERVYENFLSKIKDYDILEMTNDDAMDFMHDYLISAIPKFHLCKEDLNDRDDLLQRFNCDLSDEEIEIISNYMVIDYLDANYIRVPTLLKASLSSTDFNSYSPANMLSKLTEMQNRYVSDNETRLARYAWMDAVENGISWGKWCKTNKKSDGRRMR